ncbi:GntR family transcriptional regulator [Nonomuraea fuscirosea]
MTSARSTSVFRELANDIREKIENGTYPLGEKLPTEVELAKDYGVTRPTVNRALRILLAEGWVRVHRGVGTIVRDFMPIVRDASVRHSKTRRERDEARGAFQAELAERDFSFETRNIVDRVAPPARVAALLGVSTDEISTLMRARYMKIIPAPDARHVPYQIAVSYIPLTIAAGTQMEDDDTGVGGISSRLAEAGRKQKRILETTSVRPPTEDEIDFLGVTEDQRVFDIEHVGVTKDGEPVKVTLYSIPTHMSILRYTIELDD